MTGLFSIPPSHLPQEVLPFALMGFGLIVGVLTGLFGVGGGFMIVPLLNVLFGIPMPLAIGSSLCFTIGTGGAGLARHLRLRNVEAKSMIILGGAAVCGALLGTELSHFLQLTLGAGGAKGFEHLMSGVFIVMLALTTWLVVRGGSDKRTGAALLQRLPLPPRIDLPDAGLKGVSLPGLCAIGLGIGVMKGLLGIGGGVLFMPVLILVVGLSPRKAVGTSLGVVTFSSAAGTIAHGLEDHVNLMIAMSLLIGSAFGVLIGANFCQRLHETKLRRFFGILVMLVVVWLAIDLAVSLWSSGQ